MNKINKMKYCIMLLACVTVLTSCRLFVSQGGALEQAGNNYIVSYQDVPCNLIDEATDNDVLNNVTYWLRYMRCQSLKTPEQKLQQYQLLQHQYHKYQGIPDWTVLFRYNIVIMHVPYDETERRQVASLLFRQCDIMPKEVCSLVNLWTHNQNNITALYREYHQNIAIKEKYEQEIARLSEERDDLQLKLNRLADIEHQLQSRITMTKQQKDASLPIKIDSSSQLVESTTKEVDTPHVEPVESQTEQQMDSEHTDQAIKQSK